MKANVAKRLVPGGEPPVDVPPRFRVKGGKRERKMNEAGYNKSLQMLADKMFFEYCEGASIEDLARRHAYQARTVRFLASNKKWTERRRKMLRAIQAACADQFTTDQAVRARYFYSRHGQLLIAATGAGDQIITRFMEELREKGEKAALTADQKRLMGELNICAKWIEKIAAAADKTFAMVKHGNMSFQKFEGKEEPIETKKADGSSAVAWAQTGAILPSEKVAPTGGLLDRQSTTLERLAEIGIQVNSRLPGSVKPD